MSQPENTPFLKRTRLWAPWFMAIALSVYAYLRGPAGLFLAGLLFIWPGWRGAALNINLIDGLLPITAAVIGFTLSHFLQIPWLTTGAIVCLLTWLFCSWEAHIRTGV
ncbi:MAG: hypothetical protein QM758_07690 [Armatimonas sp.]